MKKKTKFSQKLQSKNSFWAKIFKWGSLGVLFIGAVVSMIFGSMEVSKKNGNSNISEFGDSYNVRHTTNLKIDYSGASSAPNYNDILINGTDYLTNTEKAKQVADVYQRWLYDNNIYNTGVQYSVDSSNNLVNIETNVYNLSKIQWDWDYTNDLRSQYLSDVFFNNVSNSFIEVVKYNKSYNVQIQDDGKQNILYGKEKYANGQKIFTSSGLDLSSASKYNKNDFSNSSNEKYTNNAEGVLLNTVNSSNIIINDFIELKKNVNELESASSTRETTDETDQESTPSAPAYATDYKWYVFKDLTKLIKRLNYVQMVCVWNNLLDQTTNNIDYINLFDKFTNSKSLPTILTFPGLTADEKVSYLQKGLYETLSSDEKTWGDAVADWVVNNKNNFLWVNDTNILDFYNHVVTDITSDVFGVTNIGKEQDSGYFNSSIDNIVSSYIISEITYDNYTDFFPQAKILNDDNPNKNQDTSIDVKANKVRFLYSSSIFSSINELNESKKQDECVNFMKENVSQLPIYIERNYKVTSSVNKSIVNLNKTETIKNLTANLNAADDWKQFTSGFDCYSYLGERVLKNSVTGMSAYNSMFLASGIILFMIAIFISVFYRVPGIFGSIGIIVSTIIATSLNFIIGLTFSFATTLAIFAGIFLGVSSVVIIMERIRKNMKEGMSIFDAVDNSWRKSIMQVVDIHIVSILIGLSLSFLGKGQTLDFGFQLILSASISLICMMLFFYLYLVEFVKEPFSWNGKLFYQKLKLSKTYDNFYVKLTSNFNWKSYTIISIVLLLIFIIVIILVFTIGIQNSLTYNEGTSLYIYENISSSIANSISKELGISWSLTSNNSEFTLIQSTVTMNDSTIQAVLNKYGISSFIVARSTTTIPLYEAQTNMLAILASSGFVATYILIRYGIFAIIPVFTSTIFGLLFGMSTQYITYLPINTFFTYTSVFIFVLLNIIIISELNVLRSRFNKKVIFEINDIKTFFTRNLVNMKNYFIIILSLIFVSSIISIVFSSETLMLSYLSMMINSIFAIIASIVVFNITYYGFVALRQKYLANIIHNAFENRSSKYDLVDEELVKGINQF